MSLLDTAEIHVYLNVKADGELTVNRQSSFNMNNLWTWLVCQQEFQGRFRFSGRGWRAAAGRGTMWRCPNTGWEQQTRTPQERFHTFCVFHPISAGYQTPSTKKTAQFPGRRKRCTDTVIGRLHTAVQMKAKTSQMPTCNQLLGWSPTLTA